MMSASKRPPKQGGAKRRQQRVEANTEFSPRDLVLRHEGSDINYAIVMDNDAADITFYKEENKIPTNPLDTTQMNMAVRTEPLEQKGISYASAVRRLQALTRSPRRKEEMMVEIQRLITLIGETLPPRVVNPPIHFPRIPPTDIQKQHSVLVRKIYLFILTGSIQGKYRKLSKHAKNFDDLRFMDDDVTDVNHFSVTEFLKHATLKNLVWNFSFKLMVLVKLIFSKNDTVHCESIKAFEEICDTPSQLFLFVELCQDYDDREGLKIHQELTRQQLLSKRLNRFTALFGDMTTSNSAGDGEMIVESKIDSSVMARPVHSNQQSNSKLHLKTKVLKCVRSFYEDKLKCIDLLLYFLLNDTDSNVNKKVDHVHLIRLSHPKFEEGRRSDLIHVIISYILHKKKGFETEVEKFVEKHPFIVGLENTLMTVIWMHSDIKKLNPSRDEDVKKFLDYWQEYGKRNARFGSGKTELVRRYMESKEEYLNQESFAYNLTIQQIEESFLYLPEVWFEIVEDIPYLVMLDKLSFLFQMKEKHAVKILYIKELAQKIVTVISDRDRLMLSKEHPVILIKYYHNLRNILDNLHSTHPNHFLILDSLYKTFHDCLKCPKFKDQYATHKRYCFALDVTYAMFNERCYNNNVPAIDAALAMLMCFHKFEEYFQAFAFSDAFVNLNELLQRGLLLNELKEEIKKLRGVRVDCYHAVKFSLEIKLDVDIFIILSAENAFACHHQEDVLNEYRVEMHRPFTKMIVCAMSSSDFNFADPRDDLMFDVCGFDENVPKYISRIAKLGEVTE